MYITFYFSLYNLLFYYFSLYILRFNLHYKFCLSTYSYTCLSFYRFIFILHLYLLYFPDSTSFALFCTVFAPKLQSPYGCFSPCARLTCQTCSVVKAVHGSNLISCFTDGIPMGSIRIDLVFNDLNWELLAAFTLKLTYSVLFPRYLTLT